ncbi:hypothetical protein MLD38_034414 [Melastoma candidum]|uniref:Uncharacterized protein n=1 Tax=Melastoma candidum TaxID=119954 RepID=A0ACB9MBY5_9MYRT|nr:hypothetical protein MLD38_034414 [Melastoma candidum]
MGPLTEAYKWSNCGQEDVAGEGETGKVYRANFHDRQGRSVLKLRPAFQNTASLDNQMRHLVYLIENAILNLPRIEEHGGKYFLDAKTFQKVKFVYPKNKDSGELMRTSFDEGNLPSEFGGRAMLSYDHEEFSRLMTWDDKKAANLRCATKGLVKSKASCIQGLRSHLSLRKLNCSLAGAEAGL